MEVKIKQGEEMIDATIEMVDGVMVVSPKEVKFEPKDGDVVSASGFYNFVFIYKDNLTAEAYYYAALSIRDCRFMLPDGGHIGYVNQLRPATEDEKQKLFDRLAEEGWEWKADTKELVKIKWKPSVGQHFYYPDYDNENCKFVVKSCTYAFADQIERDKVISKHLCFKTITECHAFCDRLNEAINQVKP